MRLVLGMALILQLTAAGSHAQDAVVPPAQTAELRSQAGPPDETARPTFEAGRRAYEAGRYAEALDAFQRVFVQTAHPAMLINIANAHVRLGEHKRAGAALEQYLTLVPDAPDRLLIEDRIAALYSQPDTTVLAGAPPPAAAPAPPPARAEFPVLPDPAPAPAPRGLFLGRTYSWIALGTSLVFAGAASLFWIDANQRFERAALTCGSTAAGCSDKQIAEVEHGIAATNVCVAGFVATFVTAGILFAVEGGAPSESAPVHAGLGVGPGGVALGLSGRM